MSLEKSKDDPIYFSLFEVWAGESGKRVKNMNSVISVLRLALFFLSMSGYFFYVYDRYKIQGPFIPAIVFSSIICVLTFAGYLNILLLTTGILYLIGFLLFISFLLKSNQRKVVLQGWKSAPKICVFFTLGLLAYFVVLLRGVRLTSYDDFSHWGVVVKEMLLYNRIPNAQSAVVEFKAYPLASSSFIYFTEIMIGQTESKMLIAQMILNLSYGFAFYGIISLRKKPVLQGITIIASVFMIAGFTSFSRLWVDTLLSLSSVAATAIIVKYRGDMKRACLAALPVLASMGLMKNSGIFFVLFNCALLFYFAKKGPSPQGRKEKRLRYLYAAGTTAAACMMLYLWHAHTNYTFPDSITKHMMSLSYYETVFNEKTVEDIHSIIKAFLQVMLSPATSSTNFFVLINLSVIGFTLLFFILFRKKAAALIKALVFSDVMFVLYLMGMLGMYLVSMPTEEALRVAAYARYASSAVIYQLGVIVIGFVLTLEQTPQGTERTTAKGTAINRIKEVAVGLCVMGLVFANGHVAIGGKYEIFHSVPEYEQTLPASLDRFIPENNTGYTKESYLICDFSDEPMIWYTNGYLHFIAQYKLFTSSIEIMTDFNEATLVKSLPEYNHLVVVHANREMNQFMARYADKNDYTGVYPIRQTFQALLQ